jgi:hypothetical protein
MLRATITKEAKDVVPRVAQIVDRVIKGFNAGGEEWSKQRPALLNAVIADPEMLVLLQDPSAHDAIVCAFIEDIVVAKTPSMCRSDNLDHAPQPRVRVNWALSLSLPPICQQPSRASGWQLIASMWA